MNSSIRICTPTTTHVQTLDKHSRWQLIPGLTAWTLDHVLVRVEWHLTLTVPVTLTQGVNLQLMSARKTSQILNKARLLTLLSDQAGRFQTLPALSHNWMSSCDSTCLFKAIAELMLAQFEVCNIRVCIVD